MNRINRTHLLAAGVLMALASLAQAQYMWIDEKGMKQLSDRPPPPSIPLKNVLKAPRGLPSAADVAADQATRAPTPEAAKPQAPSLAQQNADFRKRAKEKEELEQKQQAAEATKSAKAQDCERAESAKYSYESGIRVATFDKNGERSIMTDEQRAAGVTRANKTLAGCK
jgi:type IV secretory pathway VirB10-like protein